MKRFALVGNANSGKTTLFNGLTGSTAHVGNWPGVTVDQRVGVCKKGEEQVEIVDLPGIYSLSPYTPEEVVSRNYIIDQKPDCVINIVDATNLERNLYLSTQIMEIDVPMVIALNMMDEVEKRGDVINVKRLSEKIGIPIIQISALKEQGLTQLVNTAIESSKTGRKGVSVLENFPIGHLVGDVTTALRGLGVESPLFHAIKLCELDKLETTMHGDLVGMIDAFKETFRDDLFGNDYEAMIADSRYRHITEKFSIYLKRGVSQASKRSEKIDRVLTHRIFAIPIFLVVLFGLFHLTFSENFLFLGGLFGEDFVTFPGTAFEGVLGEGGIFSPGVILFNLNELMLGFFGSLLEGAFAGAPVWVQGLIVDGIFGGIFAVLSFVPQILVLFLLFTILEDSGYMARIAFVLDKIFRKFGLSGRAFMPMIMGFGCSIPAIANTRTLSHQEERTATIRVIPFFSCGAKLPILTAVAGGIVMQFGIGNADLITYSMYLLGIVVAVLSVLIMRNTTLKGDEPPFIMELPSYRGPKFKNLMLSLWDKLKHYVEKAFTIILASTVAIWVVSHFSMSWEFLADEEINRSILAGVGKLLQPIFTPLGFGSQLGNYGWVFVVGAITGLIAKENVIATFGALAATISAVGTVDEEGVSSVVTMIVATGITVPALIAFIAFNMTTIPCFAAVAMAKAELPTKKAFVGTLAFWIATSFIVGSGVYLIGTWWWTSLIIFGLFAIIATILVLKNKRRT